MNRSGESQHIIWMLSSFIFIVTRHNGLTNNPLGDWVTQFITPIIVFVTGLPWSSSHDLFLFVHLLSSFFMCLHNHVITLSQHEGVSLHCASKPLRSTCVHNKQCVKGPSLNFMATRVMSLNVGTTTCLFTVLTFNGEKETWPFDIKSTGYTSNVSSY